MPKMDNRGLMEFAFHHMLGTHKRTGHGTLRQLFKILKRQNKLCKKQGTKLKFTIELPIPAKAEKKE